MTPFQVETHRLDPTTAVLEASAGTGKTFSLTALVIRLLLEGRTDGVRPTLSGILLVTFTNKATDELRTRLRLRLDLACRLWATDAPDAALARAAERDGFLLGYAHLRRSHRASDLQRLRAADAVIDQAPVSTIHSFCARILVEFAGLIGLPPDIALADDEDARRASACRDAWRAVVSSASDAPLVSALLDEVHTDAASGPALDFETLERDYRAWAGADRPFVPALGDDDATRSRWLAASPAERMDLAHASWLQVLAAGGGVRSRTAARRYLLQTIDARLELGCRRDGVLTQDGLLQHLRAALSHPERGPGLRAALAARYQAALVDEFQDTDPVQAGILTSAFSGVLLRCIGDPKQSIYRFRGADLHAYLGFMGRDAVRDRREHMTTNHRSAPGCVAVVNQLFRQERAPFLNPGIAFLPSAAGRSDERLQDGDGRHLVWWWLDIARKGDAERALLGAITGELQRLCRQARLRERTESGEPASIPFSPRHAAVLTATNAQAAAVADALRAAGISAINRSLESVCASEAAMELSTVLAALADPSDGALARTAVCTRLWGGTQALLTGSDDALGQSLASLRTLSRSWRHLGVLGAVGRILRTRQTRARILGDAGGERYLTDLFHVAELAHAHGERPAVAVAWLHEQRAAGVSDDAASLRLEDDGDAVTVMTVHAAKGLEWPVVVAPYLWCTPSRRDMVVSLTTSAVGSQRPIRHRDERGWQWDWRGQGDAAVANSADADTRAEAVRQAYVALTRAGERTYVAWGPLGAAERNAARSGLALIAGISAATCTHPVAHTQARATDEWLWPDLPSATTQDAARLLRTHPEGLLKKGFIDGGIPSGEWGTVSKELTSFGWATKATSVRYLPTEKSPDEVPSPPTQDTFRDLLGTQPPPGVQVVVTPPTAVARTPRMAPGAPLAAEPVRAAITPPWSITSFTGLTKGADELDLLGALGDEMPGTADPAPAAGIHAFPAGAGPGDCLHRIIERTDLGHPRSERNAALVHAALASERIAAQHEPAVMDLLDELAHSRIPGTATALGALTAGALRHEWPFDLALRSAHGLAGLAAAFRRNADAVLSVAWADRMANLRDHDLTGYLTGRADLIACIDGRWWVIDWKSNRLGRDAAAYSADAVLENALDHRYPLQWMLYLVALHRHCGSRLRGYDPARHLGGAAYCYLRGLRRGDADAGWLVHRPSPAFLADIDASLGGRSPGGAA